jgi:hypothetical protein
MKLITLVPHHCGDILFVKDNIPLDSAYDGVQAKAAKKIYQQIVANPDQKVKVVIALDSICMYCPTNEKGKNYNPNLKPENCYSDSTIGRTDAFWMKMYGLEDVLNKSVTSSELINRMEEHFYVHRRIGAFFRKLFSP